MDNKIYRDDLKNLQAMLALYIDTDYRYLNNNAVDYIDFNRLSSKLFSFEVDFFIKVDDVVFYDFDVLDYFERYEVELLIFVSRLFFCKVYKDISIETHILCKDSVDKIIFYYINKYLNPFKANCSN